MWNILIANKLEKWECPNLWRLHKEGLSTVMQDFNKF